MNDLQAMTKPFTPGPSLEHLLEVRLLLAGKHDEQLAILDGLSHES